MRATTFILAMCAAAMVAVADVVPTVQWDVETGRLAPVPYTLSIRRGESANLQPRFLSYNSPMVLTGATVQLRYWYTGQAGYYATTGSLMAATGRVQIAWYDALCPASNALNYEVRCTIGTNVLARAYGPLNLLTGTSGTETNGQVRTSLDWGLLDQTGGTAVLSNQMGSGATWNGSAWTFAAAGTMDHGALTNLNGDVDYQHISTARVAAIDAALPANATNGAEWGSHAGLMTLLGGTLPYDGAILTLRGTNNAYSPFLMLFNDQGNNAGLRFQNGGAVYADIVLDDGVLKRSSEEGLFALLDESFGAVDAETATNIAQAVVAPYTNQVTGAAIAAAGGLTNRAFVTATELDCSPTTTITRAMIDAAPWGEMSLALTQACYLTFDATVTGTTDAATFAIYLTGTNALTWNTNQLTGTAWTNATATGSDRLFRKPARAGTVVIW